MLFNTFVHVVMYYYYYLKSVGISPKWKSAVTSIQIIQFLSSFLGFLGFIYLSYYKGSDYQVNNSVEDLSYFNLAGLSNPCRGAPLISMQAIFNATLLYGFVEILFRKRPKGKKDL